MWASVILKFLCTSSFWSGVEKTGAAEYFIHFLFVQPHTNHSSATEGECVSVFSFYLSFSVSLMSFIRPASLLFFCFPTCSLFNFTLQFSFCAHWFTFLFMGSGLFFFYTSGSFTFFSFPFCFSDLYFLFIWVTTLVSVDDPVAGFYRQRARFSRVCCFFFNLLSLTFWPNALESMFNFLKPDSSSHFVTYFKDTSRDPSSSLSLLLLFSSSQTRPSFITPPALNFCCCSSQLFTNIKATFMLTTGSVCHVLFKHSYSLTHTHTHTFHCWDDFVHWSVVEALSKLVFYWNLM